MITNADSKFTRRRFVMKPAGGPLFQFLCGLAFLLGVSGAGALAPPSAISIDLPAGSTILVNEETSSVSIPIIRTGDTSGGAGFDITASTNAGDTATLNTDYQAPGSPQSLGAGQSTLNVLVPILNPAGTNEANEVFTVTISNATGGATIGSVSSVKVLIVDSVDTAPPAPVITAPAAGSVHKLPTGGIVTVTGTVTDNKGVKQVRVSLNGAPFVDATINSSNPSPLNTGFTLPVVPIGGTNTLTVKALDHRNNLSALVTRTFTVQRPLVVNLDSATYGSVTTGFAGSTFREVGRSYTITATPKAPVTTPFFAGGLFTGWTVTGATNAQLGIVESAKQKKVLTFIFREGVALTANFVENPFVPLAGVYNGLIRPDAALPDRSPAGPGPEDGTLRNNATEGAFKATVQNTGAFSATMSIDGGTLSFSGAFDENGNARFGTARLLTQSVARTNKPGLLVSLQMDLVTPGTNDKITGTVTATAYQQSIITDVSNVDSDRAFYNGAAQMVPAAYLNAANANGSFSIILPPPASPPPGLTARDFPQGYGQGTFTISKAGVVTFGGTTADGWPIGGSTTLSQGNTFPLFVPMYDKKGFLSGMVDLDNSDPDSDMSGPALNWLRPFIPASNEYPAGWPTPVTVDLLGAKYTAVAGQSAMKLPGGAALPAADGDGNVALVMTDGQLSDDLIKAVNLSTGDVATNVPANDPTFSLSVLRTAGRFVGSFIHTDDTRPNIFGVIYQKGAFAGGYGYFKTVPTVPIDYRGEAGSVQLIGQP